MKKLLIAAAVTTAAISTSAMAVQPQYFGGVLYGKSDMKFDTSGGATFGGGASTADVVKQGLDKVNKPNTYGIRAGAYLNPNTRVYGTYTYGKKDSHYDGAKFENKNQTLLLSADYLFGTQAAKPFVGVSAGANKLKVGAGDFSKDKTDFVYGAQAGVNWSVTQNVDLEVGYQYLKNNNEYKHDALDTKIELDHTQNVYLAVDYRF